ncbi:hypothetical protein PIB30_002003 [Stylosanthes scabra]|uniref:Uncharacterized protein n=1 Tax=Stylosanthes scabra TaxID=79078 RepID=A0ABU6Z0Y1_9FABA|nr:hypothetical protein [Stylosanthes scabra]
MWPLLRFRSSSKKRILYVPMVLVLLVTALFLQIAAIRVFPRGDAPPHVEFSHRITAATKIANKDLFNKYFNNNSNGRTTATRNKNTRTQKGFDESKRRVPSCPDPLHN